MISDAVLNQIQDRLDIVDVVSGYLTLRRAGKNFKANCPFHHEKTPSFIVNPDKQIFHCFGCGVGGNVFSFVMKFEKKDFREVAEQLADRAGVEIPSDRPVDAAVAERSSQFAKANEIAMEFFSKSLFQKEAEPALGYLHRRGVSEKMIEDFRIGWAPDAWDAFYQHAKGRVPDAILERAGLLIAKKEGAGYYDRFRKRVMFPILDAKGVCVAFGGRVLDDSLPKYLNSPETEIYSKGRNLYGLYQARKAIREQDAAVIVEGYMDLIACRQAGLENVVASLGTALTTEQVRLIKRNTKNAVILYDADKAGEMATLRGLELFLEEGMDVKIVRLPEGHDPDSFVKDEGAEAFHAQIAAARTLFDYKLDLLKKQHDVSTLDGKVKIANEMVALFNKVDNEILKAAWLQELSAELRLSEAALEREMAKGGPKAKTPAADSRETAPARMAGEVLPVEKLLLGFLFDSPEFTAEARNVLGPDSFTNPQLRVIAKRVFESEETPTAAQLINYYKNDAEMARLITMACAEMETVLDKHRTFEDCVRRLRHLKIRTERDGLLEQIRAAENIGDLNRISKLQSDLHELNKRDRQLNEKK